MFHKIVLTVVLAFAVSSHVAGSEVTRQIERSARASTLPFDDGCVPAAQICREGSMKDREAITHPMLREVLPGLAEVLGLDPKLRYRLIDLTSTFSDMFYDVVRRYPCLLPLWDQKEAHQQVKSLIARCEPKYDHKLHTPAKVNGDRNRCYLEDLKERLGIVPCGEFVCLQLPKAEAKRCANLGRL